MNDRKVFSFEVMVAQFIGRLIIFVFLQIQVYFRLFTSVLILEPKRIDDVSGRNCDVLLIINRK